MGGLFKKDKSRGENKRLIERLSRGSTVVGIDIGYSSVNIAQMANYKGKPTLIKTRVVDIVKNPKESRDEATLRALHEALKDFGGRSIKYTCVVNCPQSCVRKVITPYMPKEDLRGAVGLEAKRSIPFPLTDAVWDFNVIEAVVEKGVEKLSIIVAASPKQTIERILSFFIPKKAKPFSGQISKKFEGQDPLAPLGLKISALLPLSLCLENIIERSNLKTEETLVTIEMGAFVTELNVYKNSRLQFSRKIPFAGDEITKSLTGALITEKGRVELSLEEAEVIKREYGIPRIEENKMIDDKITTNQVLSLLRPKVEQLANEIERSFSFFREQMHGGKVDRLVLFGGGAQLKGLPEFLHKELGVEVQVGNPLADIDMILDDVVGDEDDAHKLVLAIGAALSKMKGINLLPVETRDKTKRSVKKAVINLLVIALIALVTLAYVPLKLSVDAAYKKFSDAQAKLNRLDPQLLAVKEQMLVENLLSAHPYWDEVFKEMSNVIPANVYLRSMKMKDDKLEINGVVESGLRPSESVLSRFMVDLEKGIFKNVRLVSTRKDLADSTEIEFKINAMVE